MLTHIDQFLWLNILLINNTDQPNRNLYGSVQTQRSPEKLLWPNISLCFGNIDQLNRVLCDPILLGLYNTDQPNRNFHGSVYTHIDQLSRKFLWLNISLCSGNIDQLNRVSCDSISFAFIVSAHQKDLWHNNLNVPYICQLNRDHLWLKYVHVLEPTDQLNRDTTLWLSRPWPVHSSWLPQIGYKILICWNTVPSRTMENCLQIGETSPHLLTKWKQFLKKSL